jgi:hypothetical protein
MSAEDYELESALQVLVHKATSKKQSQVDPSTLQGIKTLCKASDENVTAVFGLLYDRLKQPHSQVRCHDASLDDGWIPAVAGSECRSSLC